MPTFIAPQILTTAAGLASPEGPLQIVFREDDAK
jgi:hypothetical protein